jgi:hypothetical protein
MRPRNVVLLALAVSVFLMTGLIGSAPRAAALTPDQQFFLTKINALRSSLGLQDLQIDPELQALADSWASYMASTQQLVHPADQYAGVTTPVYLLGDNIAFGDTIDVVWTDFVNSPVHYHNLTDARFDHVGIGVATASNGSIYVIHRFMATLIEPPTAPPDTEAATTVPPTVDTTAPPPTVEVLAESVVKPVNMAVIPPIRYGGPVAPPPVADQASSKSSNLFAILLAGLLALLALVAVTLAVQHRRRATGP